MRHGFRFQPALDGLRGVAVVAVLAYHLRPDLVPGGFLGVDAFFVLSGYLITGLLLAERTTTGRIDLPAFWGRRLRRLLPALLLLLVVVSVAVLAWTPPVLLGRYRGDALASLAYVANWRFVLSGQSYFESLVDASPLRHLWSLAIEEQFYLVWPLVAALVLRAGRRHLAAVAALGSVASILAMAALHDPVDPARAYYGTDARAHSILVGALVALAPGIVGRVAGSRLAPVGGALAAAGGVAMIVLVPDRATWMYHGGYALFAVAVAAVLVAALAPGGPVRWALGARPLRATGRVSYGLYLWHWPVIVLLDAELVGIDGWALDGFQVAVTVTATWLSYRLLEQPVRQGRLGPVVARIAAPAGLAATAGVVAIATTGSVDPPDFGAPAAPARVEVRAAAPAARPVRDRDHPPPAAPRPRPAADDDGDAVSPPLDPPPTRVLLVGDSVAYTFQDALGDELVARGITYATATGPGCGVVAEGVVADRSGAVVSWAPGCRDILPGFHRNALAEAQPDLVVWLSTWELEDRIVDGRHLRFGTPAMDRFLARALDETAERLTSTGARLLVLNVPPVSDADLGPADPEENARRVHYDKLVRAFVARDPDRRRYGDLAAIVCGAPVGSGSCPATRDGVRLRPTDGDHFDENGARAVAPAIAELVVRGGEVLEPVEPPLTVPGRAR